MIPWKPLWEYVKERESIRLAKLAGKPWPWSKDPIFQQYSFTNVKREHDKTSQAFLTVYEENHDADPHTALLNCGLRRFTGTVAASNALGWVEPDAKLEPLLNRAERECDAAGLTFWTGAYMIRGGAAGVPKYKVVAGYLKGLQGKAREITDRMAETLSWRQGYYLMHSLYGFGGEGFMAKEVLQDYLLWCRRASVPAVRDQLTFTPIGPGARRGLNRLLKRGLTQRLSEEEGNALINELRERVQAKWSGHYRGTLTAHDIQFCLCELDKYLRTSLGEGRPRSSYSPPKEVK